MRFLIVIFTLLLPIQGYCFRSYYPEMEPIVSGGAKKCIEMVEYFFVDQPAELYRIHYYNEQGRIIKREIHPNSAGTKTQVYTYNSNGQILSQKSYGEYVPTDSVIEINGDYLSGKWDNHVLTEGEDYHYINGLLVRKEYRSYYYGEASLSFELYYYDTPGKLKRSLHISPAKEDSSMSITYIDKNGKKHIRYSDTTTSLYSYTDTSIVVTHKSIYGPESKTKYTINKDGQTIASRFIDTKRKTREHTIYIYNEHKQHTNTLYKIREQPGQPGPLLTNTHIEYDSLGRIKKTSYYSGHKLTTIHSFSYE